MSYSARAGLAANAQRTVQDGNQLLTWVGHGGWALRRQWLQEVSRRQDKTKETKSQTSQRREWRAQGQAKVVQVGGFHIVPNSSQGRV